MKLPSAFFRGLAFAGLGLGLSLSAIAQSVLLADHKGKALPVRSANKGVAMVEDNGRRVAASGTKFALKKVDEFLPAFVTVRDMSSQTKNAGKKNETGKGDANHTLEFQAGFEAAYALKDVFIVIEFNFSDDQKTFFIYEVGQLEPRRRKDLKLDVPTGRAIGEDKFQLHVFSQGIEVFHSQQPLLFREQQLDAMVAQRVKTLTDANPQPLFGPMPVYPAKFAKTKAKGQANIAFHVGQKGEVLEPVATSASDPAFGEAAIAALREWRFLPKVVAGRPVETDVEMPMTFDPPL
jgi:TonB family protein